MTELDLKKIREKAVQYREAKIVFVTEPESILALLDRLEKAESIRDTSQNGPHEIVTKQYLKQMKEQIDKRDAQLENTESLIAQLTEEIAYGNKVITEKDAQLEKSYVDRNALTRKQARIEELEAQLAVCVEALKKIDLARFKEENITFNDVLDIADKVLEKLGVVG